MVDRLAKSSAAVFLSSGLFLTAPRAETLCPGPGIVVRGTVVDGAGNPIPGGFVRIVPGGRLPGAECVTRTDGVFELRCPFGRSDTGCRPDEKRCDGQPDTVRPMAGRAGDWITMREFPMGDVEYAGDDETIEVPPLVAGAAAG